jgi:hypothetical protein
MPGPIITTMGQIAQAKTVVIVFFIAHTPTKEGRDHDEKHPGEYAGQDAQPESHKQQSQVKNRQERIELQARHDVHHKD